MYWARWNSVPCNQNKQAITRHWGFEMCYFYLGRNCQKIWYQKHFLGHSQNPKVFKGLGSNKSLIIIQIIWIYSKVASVLCFPLCSQARESYLKASTAKMLEPQGSLGSVALSLYYLLPLAVEVPACPRDRLRFMQRWAPCGQQEKTLSTLSVYYVIGNRKQWTISSKMEGKRRKMNEPW